MYIYIYICIRIHTHTHMRLLVLPGTCPPASVPALDSAIRPGAPPAAFAAMRLWLARPISLLRLSLPRFLDSFLFRGSPPSAWEFRPLELGSCLGLARRSPESQFRIIGRTHRQPRASPVYSISCIRILS